MDDAAGPTWIVMIRDVSHSVLIEHESAVIACMVLDAGSGLIRGISMAATPAAASAQAMELGLTTAVGPLPPQAPSQVLCLGCDPDDVRATLRPLLNGAAEPSVDAATPINEAEDIFDSLIGQLAGRPQPDDFPTPDDWMLLVAVSGRYCRAEPWRRWSDVHHLDLVVKVDGTAARYVAVVIGQEGIQRGLALYPGAVVPTDFDEWQPGDPLPAGMLVFWLDPPDEVQPEFAGKAQRYGWPSDLEFLPTWLAGQPEELSDISQRDAHHLTLAITAVLDHHDHDTAKSAGDVALAQGALGSYTVS